MGIMSKLQVTGRDLLTQPEIEHHSARFTKFINKLVLYTFNDTMDASSRGRETRFVYRTMPDSSLSLAKDNAMSRKRVRQIDRLNIQLVLQFNQLQERNVRPKDKVLIDILDWKWIAGQLLDELIDLVHFGRGATQWRESLSLRLFFFSFFQNPKHLDSHGYLSCFVWGTSVWRHGVAPSPQTHCAAGTGAQLLEIHVFFPASHVRLDRVERLCPLRPPPTVF
jgi:hypothetical protein